MTKQVFSFLAFCLFFTSVTAQRTEFTIHPNGLIYDVATMGKLNHIVDSLNLKFRVCEPKNFLAKAQTVAHFVHIQEKNVKEALKDLKGKMSFDAFIAKYPHATIRKNTCVTQYHFEDSKGNERVGFREMNLSNGDGTRILPEGDSEKDAVILRGQWVVEYSEKTEYSKENIDAFYFTEDMKAQPMLDKYARMVQYTECMVDTTEQIFLESARRNRYSERWENKNSKKITSFLAMVHDFPNKPKYEDYKIKSKTKDTDDYDHEKFNRDHQIWDSLRLLNVEKLSKTPKFKQLLDNALDAAIRDTIANSDFEYYVSRYGSKEKALFLKRSRIVVGGCSQDQSPRYHAQDIAVLAAETAKWEVFLRAHLDIMNDRFERVSDGNYAWVGRQTYIKELEELGINVPDLLLGISLRVENTADNHYFGNIGRLGRALAETKYQDEIEQKMLSMIEDKDLDTYNRIVLYFLFKNYNYNLKEDNRKKQNVEKLKKAVKSMPEGLAAQADFEDKD